MTNMRYVCYWHQVEFGKEEIAWWENGRWGNQKERGDSNDAEDIMDVVETWCIVQSFCPVIFIQYFNFVATFTQKWKLDFRQLILLNADPKKIF